ncbi:MAG: ExeM/NucH family extracellular endonuclease [Polyangiales bacterium]
MPNHREPTSMACHPRSAPVVVLSCVMCSLAWLASSPAAVSAACGGTVTPIGVIQGSGPAAALSGSQHVRGVVVGDFEYTGSGAAGDTLRGFYLQNLPDDADGDPLTSDGIFVFNANADSVSVGQIVEVVGEVTEYDFNSTGGTLTELSAPRITQCDGAGSITPVDVTLPLASADELERYEGMLVHFPQPLSVTEHFQLGRFGQLVVSVEGRLRQPTSVAAPGADALAVQAANVLRRIVVDDGSQRQNPDPIPFARGGEELSASNPLRGGDTIANLTGVLAQSDATSAASVPATTDPVLYRVLPLGVLGASAPVFEPAAPRPSVPMAIDGALKVAGVNLLNYFNTFGNGCRNGVDGPATECRGAGDALELARQRPKTVAAILATGADIVVLNELENDGYGPDSALADLIAQLNAATAPDTFAFVDVDAQTGQVNALGNDAIRVGVIYKPASVQPVGQTAVANTGAFGVYETGAGPFSRNRPALAQAFADHAGARLIVVGNHLKSKGSSCADNISPVGPDRDVGDGQGECNLTRTAAADQLVTWLASDPTATGTANVLILGDFNAYTREAPIERLVAGGYTNLIEARLGPDAYSYVFDGTWGYLDYAFASPALLAQVRGVGELHINADEPAVLDYNTDFKTSRQQSLLYAPDAFRASDHDPVVVGLALQRDAEPDPDAGVPGDAAAWQWQRCSWSALPMLIPAGFLWLRARRRQRG